jgi:tight adherence protein B
MPENLQVPNLLIPNLLIPALLLLGVFIGAGFALRADNRNKRLLRRVNELVPARDAHHPRQGRGADIRAGRAPERRLGTLLLLRILLVPVDLPAAQVISPRVVWSTGVVAAVLTALFAAPHMAPPLAIGAGLLIGALLLRAVFGWERSRYRRILLRQLPDAIQLVVSATRAGLPIREAFRSIAQEMPAPTNLEFGRIVNEMTLGVRPEDALFALHRRTGVGEYAIFAVTIGVQMKSGGRLAETIQTLAETVRQRQTMAARAHALASEARTSLPFVAGVLLSAIHPGYLDPLFQDPRGTRLLIIGVAGIVLGIWSMRQLIIQAASE